jgi:hypothetical protein
MDKKLLEVIADFSERISSPGARLVLGVVVLVILAVTSITNPLGGMALFLIGIILFASGLVPILLRKNLLLKDNQSGEISRTFEVKFLGSRADMYAEPVNLMALPT